MGYTHYYHFNTQNINKNDFAEAVHLFEKCLDELKDTKVTFYVYDYLSNPIKDKNGNDVWYKERKLKRNVPLFGWDGTGEPTINDTEIRFNGDASEGLDHETFSISINDKGGNFCKTARKPYDLAVCLCLLCFKEIFGDDFAYSSDGVCIEDKYNNKERKEWFKKNGKRFCLETEWKRAIKIYRKVVKPMFSYSSALHEKFAA